MAGNQPTKSCVICSKDMITSDKYKSIALTPRDLSISYYDIMSYVFPRSRPNKGICAEFTPVKQKYIESRVICQVCGVAVKNAYVHLRQVNSILQDNSYVHRHFISEDEFDENESTEVAPREHSVTLAKQSTPIQTKIKNAYEDDIERQRLQAAVHKILRDEVKTFAKFSSLKSGNFNVQSISETVLVSEMMELCPTVYKCISGLYGTSVDSKDLEFNPFMKTAACIAGFSQNSHCNQFQKMVGLCLYRDGASRKLYKILNSLGVSISYDAVVYTLDKLRTNLDTDLIKWKEGVQSFCKEMRNTPVVGERPEAVSFAYNFDLPEGITPLGGVYQDGAVGGQLFKAGGALKAKKKFQQRSGSYYSLTFSFDNINKHVTPRHYNSESSTVVMNMTSAFATFSRIPLPWSELEAPVDLKEFSSLALETWLPSRQDFEVIKYDMKREIRKVLVRHLSVFSCLSSSVELYTSHDYTKESNEPSSFVPLGIFNIDENTTDGMLKIIDEFKKYVPINSKGEKVPLVAFGDGLSTDRMRSAQESILNADSFDALSPELIPGNSAWHKRVLLLTNDFKDLMPEISKCSSMGTLAHFRVRFGHVKASASAERSFNHSYYLLKFVAESYILAYASQLMKLKDNSLDDMPERIKQIAEDKKLLADYLEKVVDSILKFCWHDIERSVFQRKYCICDTLWDKKRIKEYIGCDNSECGYKLWYHKCCLNSAQKNPENPYRRPAVSKKKKWYCSADCAKHVTDKKYLYSKAVMFLGMLHECFKQSIKQNDGRRMQVYHKLHMIQFCNNGVNHPLYLRIYHRILSLMENGPPSVRNDLLNNSTINFKGFPGGNLSMDFVNEVFNKIMKENLNYSKGNLNPDVVVRRSCSVWGLSELRDELMQEVNTEIAHTRSKSPAHFRRDLQNAVGIIASEELLTFVGNRFHTGHEDFEYKRLYMDDVEFFREEMERLAVNMDLVKIFTEEERHSKRKRTSQI